jgi:hypothetical protein
MEEVIKQVILGAPNLAVAILALVWSSKVIDRQIEATGRLVDKLIETLAENEDLKAQIAKKDNPL